MAHMMTVDVEIVQTLIDLVEYAALRLSNAGDTGAVEYLEEQLKEVRGKFENERFGGGDLTCIQIDRLLKMLGGEDG